MNFLSSLVVFSITILCYLDLAVTKKKWKKLDNETHMNWEENQNLLCVKQQWKQWNTFEISLLMKNEYFMIIVEYQFKFNNFISCNSTKKWGKDVYIYFKFYLFFILMKNILHLILINLTLQTIFEYHKFKKTNS